MLLIALAIRVSSPGPVLIRAERVGRGGRLFTHYSFRMSRSLSGGSPESEAGATAVGRILWQLGLVDLPSVLNVLRGESPERGAALEGQIPDYRHRHRVKPGMTGWAQIHELDASEPLDPVTLLEYDLYYIKHMSLSLDAYVMLRTLKRVVQGRVSG